MLVHGDGGIGKTVFLDSLAAALSDDHEIVFFDCFGGGRYRAAEDARHLPNRGLVHIANTLACRGLCDPLLPGSDSTETLFAVFRKRMEQCIAALSRASPDRLLVLFIDAIDNAAEHAKDRQQSSFPTLLLESLQQTPIAGLRLVVSCRTYRRAISMKDVAYTDFHLEPFTSAESESYLRACIPDVTPGQIQVAHARSNGNARILEHLATSDRGLLDPSEIENPIILEDLISGRIEASLAEAIGRGSKRADIDAFLAGLSVLPPPVPLDEYAGAHNLDVSAIQSFAADLAPSLEQTNQGLMFRDEPTETLVRERYGSNNVALKRVAKNLLARQDQSVYAARALPGLLQKINDGAKLFALAFDERFPAAITSRLASGAFGMRGYRPLHFMPPILTTRTGSSSFSSNSQQWQPSIRRAPTISSIIPTSQSSRKTTMPCVACSKPGQNGQEPGMRGSPWPMCCPVTSTMPTAMKGRPRNGLFTNSTSPAGSMILIVLGQSRLTMPPFRFS